MVVTLDPIGIVIIILIVILIFFSGFLLGVPADPPSPPSDATRSGRGGDLEAVDLECILARLRRDGLFADVLAELYRLLTEEQITHALKEEHDGPRTGPAPSDRPRHP